MSSPRVRVHHFSKTVNHIPRVAALCQCKRFSRCSMFSIQGPWQFSKGGTCEATLWLRSFLQPLGLPSSPAIGSLIKVLEGPGKQEVSTAKICKRRKNIEMSESGGILRRSAPEKVTQTDAKLRSKRDHLETTFWPSMDSANTIEEDKNLKHCETVHVQICISWSLYYIFIIACSWFTSGILFKQNHPPFQTQCHRSQRSRGRSSSAMPFSGCPNLEKSTPRPSIESCFNWKAEFFEFFDFEFQTDPSMELRDLHDLACARESKTCRECFCSLLAWEIEKANHKDLEDASLWPHLWFSHHQPCTMHWQFVQKSRIMSAINLCILFLHSFAGKQLWTPILSMQLGIHTSDLKKWNELDWCFACFACFVAFFF